MTKKTRPEFAPLHCHARELFMVQIYNLFWLNTYAQPITLTIHTRKRTEWWHK